MKIFSQAVPGGIGAETTSSTWTSRTFRIGQPFKITKISLALNTLLETGDTFSILPTIITDSLVGGGDLTAINPTNYPQLASGSVGENIRIVQKPSNMVGYHSFNFKLTFSGTANLAGFNVAVALPIVIEYELIDD